MLPWVYESSPFPGVRPPPPPAVPASLGAEGPPSHSAGVYGVNAGHLETPSCSENPQSPGPPTPPGGPINHVK